MINNKDELGEFLGNLSNKIEELEKNGERDYDNIDANRGQINFNLKGIKDCWKLLAKLEKIIQKIGVKLDFTSQESGQALKDIAELRNQIQNNSVADLNHYNELKEGLSSHTNMIGVQMDKYIELKEVLRELGNNLENEPKLIQSYKDIIAKLDGTEEEKG